MYIIFIYDAPKGIGKQLFNLCSQYLFHKQNSVFSGELTQEKYTTFLHKLKKIKNSNNKYVIYKIKDYRYLEITEEQIDNSII